MPADELKNFIQHYTNYTRLYYTLYADAVLICVDILKFLRYKLFLHIWKNYVTEHAVHFLQKDL